ncbi:hypothetical protein BKA61DRAFT_682645 [Leptodontidium sp. MPI-SDFR-AT-0119]|nr:hypothetical protein BKA61DRAFT_682645 [Leptodontidium sp. MPI-SDFR-AT-0119]
MKPTTLTTFLALTLACLTSAWHLRLYRNPGYQVLIEDKSDFFSHGCTNLDPQLRGQTSSMHWEGEGALGQCTMHLYQHPGCSIPIVVKTSDISIPNFATKGVDDKVSSWKVVCQEDIGKREVVWRA